MTYLTTTRLKEFWSFQVTPILLGPWCLPAFGEESEEEVQQWRMMPSPWPGSDELEKAQIDLDEIYNALLPKLSCALNKIHGVSHSNRYWQILVGPWLMYFVHVIYDKIIRLQEGIGSYADLKIIGLSPEHFTTPLNTIDFADRINDDDLYNFQLITQVAQNIGIHIESYRVPDFQPNLSIQKSIVSQRSIKVRVFEYFQRKLLPYAKIVMYKSYHPKKFLAKLLILSHGKIVNIPDLNENTPELVCNEIKREKLEHILLFEDFSSDKTSLQNSILKMIPKELPLIFLEGYSQLETIAIHKFGAYKPKIICSAIGWYFDEPFKYWSAKSAEAGTKLWGLQHGGNYGINSFMPCEEHEFAITDKYLTWGWTKKNSKDHIIPSPAQKLIDLPRRSEISEKDKTILYCITAGSRHLIQFPLLPDHFQNYFNWQKRFLSTVEESILSLIRVRPHCEDNIWDCGKKLQKSFPILILENWNRNFRDSLLDCKIFVCDNLSTTYVEALASNTPTVLFWNHQITQINADAQPFFDELRRVSVLHDTPESAAEWVNKVYPDVATWWNAKECQAVINNFCKNYARVSRYPELDWLKVLNKLDD